MTEDQPTVLVVDDEELHGIVADLLALSTHDDRTRERFAVAQKRAALEGEKTDRELERSEEYAALRERGAVLDAELDELVGSMDNAAFRRAVAGLSEDSDDAGTD